eukprot:s558_g29.t1
MFRFLTRKLKGEDEKKAEDPYANLEPELKVHAAACNNDVKMLEKLGEERLRKSLFHRPYLACTQDGYYALDACAWSGNEDAIKMLLRHGADPAITLQAVVGAASWGDPDLLKVLLDAGGPVDQELSNETALRWAELVLRRAKGTLAGSPSARVAC